VDKNGLAKLLDARGKGFAVLELIQNALDEEVTRVAVRLQPTGGSNAYYTLTVSDDCPEGFADLSHAYTLFAESKKKADPEKRGRFNLGEKLVLAVCRRASIQTTKGSIRWEGDVRTHSRASTVAGSCFWGELRMTRSEANDALDLARRVLVPDDVRLTINHEVVEPRESLQGLTGVLPTVKADAEGYLRPTTRKTLIDVYEPREGETPMLYEMGIPVVELDCPWHVNVAQKVPLNTDRDNVTPAYLRRLLALVLNEMADSAPQEALRAPWAGEAMESDLLDTLAVGAVMTARYGEKRVIRDPSDPEANKLAVSKGYSVIEPGSFTRGQWAAIRETGAALPAGQVTPSPKPYSDDPNADPEKVIPREKWTAGMKAHADFASDLGQALLAATVRVRFVADITQPWAANYATGLWGGELCFNKGRLGNAWFEKPPQREAVIALLIHEYGHHFSGDHLSEEYHDALCMLGAKLARLIVLGELEELFR
jgi:hypothetical protein